MAVAATEAAQQEAAKTTAEAEAAKTTAEAEAAKTTAAAAKQTEAAAKQTEAAKTATVREEAEAEAAKTTTVREEVEAEAEAAKTAAQQEAEAAKTAEEATKLSQPIAPTSIVVDAAGYPKLLDGLQFVSKEEPVQIETTGGVGSAASPQTQLKQFIIRVRKQFMYNKDMPCLKLNALESTNYKKIVAQFRPDKNTNIIGFLRTFFQMAFVDVTEIINYTSTTNNEIPMANKLLFDYINLYSGGYKKDTEIAKDLIGTAFNVVDTSVYETRKYIHILKLMDFIDYIDTNIQSGELNPDSIKVIEHYFTTYFTHFTTLDADLKAYYANIKPSSKLSPESGPQSTDPIYRNDFTIAIDTRLKAQNEDRIYTYIKLSNFGKHKYLYNERYKTAISEYLQDRGLLKIQYNDSVAAQSTQMYDDKGDEIKGGSSLEPFKYTQNFLFGRFTDIFTPDLSNDDIVEKMEVVRTKALDGKPVFIFGYGASGSGKTSSLIYYAGEDGIITKLCNQFGKDHKYTDLKMITKEFSSTIVDASGQDMSELAFKFDETYTKNNKPSPSFVLTSEPCNDAETEDKVVLDTTNIRQRHEMRTGSEKQFAFDCTDKENKTLGYLMMYLVDRDRLVKATTNNPNSSRSHMMIHLCFTGTGTGTDTIPPIHLFVGDFGGVENTFMCDNAHTLSDFINIKRTDNGKESDELFYNSEPEKPDGAMVKIVGGSKKSDDEKKAYAAAAAAEDANKDDITRVTNLELPIHLNTPDDASTTKTRMIPIVQPVLAGISSKIFQTDPWIEAYTSLSRRHASSPVGSYTRPVDIIDSTTTQFKYEAYPSLSQRQASSPLGSNTIHTDFDYFKYYDPAGTVLSNVIRDIVPVGNTLYDTSVETITDHTINAIHSATMRFKTNEAQKVFFKKRVLHIPDNMDFKTFKDAVMKLSFGVVTYDKSLSSYVPIKLDSEFNAIGPVGITLADVYKTAYNDTGLYKNSDGTIDHEKLFKQLYGDPIQTGYKVKTGTNHFYTQYQPICGTETLYPLLDRIKDQNGSFCNESDKGTDQYLVESLGGKYNKNTLLNEPTPGAMVEVRAIRGISVLFFNDFEQYKNDLRKMKSYEEFFEKFVHEDTKDLHDNGGKHRKTFYLPNAFFLKPEQYVAADGIPEIPYIHKVKYMYSEYETELAKDPVYPTLSKRARDYVAGSGLTIDTVQDVYVLFVGIMVKVYVWMIQTKHRFEYGKRICARRVEEGEYINRTLTELRDNIDEIMTVKNKNVLYYSPDYVVECFDKYCPVMGKCFTPPTTEHPRENSSKIIEWMFHRYYPTDTSYEKRQTFYANIMVCVFCTFNLSRNSNNPPAIHYIDHHKLKTLVALQNIPEIQTEIAAILANMPTPPIVRATIEEDWDDNTTGVESSDNSFPMETPLVPLGPVAGPVAPKLDLIKKRIKQERTSKAAQMVRQDRTKTNYGKYPTTRRGGNFSQSHFQVPIERALAAKLHEQNLHPRDGRSSGKMFRGGGATKTPEEYAEVLYRSISPEIYDTLKAISENIPKCIQVNDLKECNPYLDKLIKLIDIHNAATPIGTLEFVDSVSKLNRIQNICYDYRRPLIDLGAILKK